MPANPPPPIDGFGSYTDTPNARGKGLAGGSDIYTASAGGAKIYSDTPNAKGKGLGGGSDVLGGILLEFPAAFAKGAPGISSAYIPIIYLDNPFAYGIGLAFSRDRLSVQETGAVKGIGHAQSSDIYIARGVSQVLYEVGRAYAKGLAGGSDLGVYLGLSASKGKGLSGSTTVIVTSDTPASRAKGLAGALASQAYTASLANAFAKGLAGGSGKMVAANTSNALAKGLSGGSNLNVYVSISAVKAKGSAVSTDVSVTIATSNALTKGLAKSVTVAVSVNGLTAYGKGFAGAIVRQVSFDMPGSLGKAIESAGDGRLAIDRAFAYAKGKASRTDSAVYTETPGAKSKGLAGRGLIAVDPNGLIPALRRQVASVYGATVSLIPEALPDAIIMRDIQLPTCIIVAGKPVDIDLIAAGNAQKVPVDFVLIDKERAGIDNAQDLRGRLATLKSALLADYQQFAGTDTAASFDTQVIATPMERENEYQQHFSDNDQKVTVMVLSMEFSVETLPYG